MKASSLNEIKNELSELKPSEVMELTLRLARYKKESKELLTYLLFEAHDEEAFIRNIKNDMDQQFILHLNQYKSGMYALKLLKNNQVLFREKLVVIK